MGCRSAPYIAQRISNLVSYIHSKMSYHLLNYVDDFLGSEVKSRIYQSHEAFIQLLNNIGIDS